MAGEVFSEGLGVDPVEWGRNTTLQLFGILVCINEKLYLLILESKGDSDVAAKLYPQLKLL